MIGTLAVLLLAAPPCPALAAKPACVDALPVFEAGCATRWVCPADVAAQGLTRLDLSDTWTPTIFREEPSLGEAGQQPYKSTYLKLAAGQVDDPEVEHRAATDRYLEPYGIFPNISVVKARLLDAGRHTCHDAVDDAALSTLTRSISPYEDPAVGRDRVKTIKALEGQFRRELKKRVDAAAKEAAKAAKAAGTAVAPPPAPVEYGPADFEALGSEKKWAGSVGKWRKARSRVEAIRGMQDHLRCDKELDRPETTGVFGWNTQLALQIFQRKQMLGARATLDAETREHLVADSHELDFRALLRALRERVVSATGLLEDGSAVGRWGRVLGRPLDSAEFRYALPGVPLANGAEDAISPATEAAALALGWSAPDAASRWLEARGDLATLVVAVKLPPPPWHSAHMDLRAEIDRGDVWYEYPVGPSGRPRSHPIERRPSNTVYARHGDREIALMRWPTTIGAWKEERLESGEVVYKYKNSDVGPRIWRNLITSPSWLPPPSTPEDDLVQRGRKGGWDVKWDILGPSYASAYGLVMLIHNQPIVRKNGKTVYFDNGIRSHGSVSYRSIVRGASHGCHRLFNHLAVRLGGFLLTHRTHTIEGNLPVTYGRRFSYKGDSLHVKITSRGFGFVLDPPVPVEVLEGRIRGRVRRPPAGSMPVP